MRKRLLGLVVVALAALAIGAVAAATPGADTLVNVGSPSTPFSQNKQNEPALAIDAVATATAPTPRSANSLLISLPLL